MAIMSIAAANLFTRNIYREYIKKDATHADEAQVSKIASLVVKLGAVAFIIFLDPQFSIDLQLIGGVIILQTAPSVALGLYTRWHRGGLIAGWAAGMAMGLWMLYNIPNAATRRAHFGGSAFSLEKFGFDTPKTIYVGFVAVAVNLLVAVIVTFILRATKTPDGTDGTTPDDYFADEGDPRMEGPDVHRRDGVLDLTVGGRACRPGLPIRTRIRRTNHGGDHLGTARRRGRIG